MKQPIGTAERPARVAIVGAGPSGFYTAEALLKNKQRHFRVDMFNRFPTPFGLVREGVAPDHQDIKAVTRVYERLLADERLRYFGNVTFGVDLLHEDLCALYDQIVYCVGAPADRKMGIPGEDLQGSYAATAFVGWYNGNPDYRDMTFDLTSPTAVVVGNGNVAMDVTRILVKSPDELAKTDIAPYALEALRASKVREVVMLGRRGPAQAAFTTPELKEFGELAGVDVIVDPRDLELDEHSAAALANDKTAIRNVELLRAYADRPVGDAPRRIVMRFLESPVEIIGRAGHVQAVTIERNRLVMDSNGGLRAKGTGIFETIEAGLVLRSVGYRGVPLPNVPFDEVAFTIPNVAGRVIHGASSEAVEREYVVGWAKRGPSGVIGTNKADAVSTVAAMLEDLDTLRSNV
ncbi:MAG TPA: FAD-dependent oxidoreductase, partial [Roseiflexaceae bacterium]|nr:FAD-dependent oxidoreductase [Roseiflexaceae bacterium]